MPFAAILLVATTVSARAVDEIQVYNAEIAKVGQWTFQLHSNYAFNGRKEVTISQNSAPTPYPAPRSKCLNTEIIPRPP